MTAEQALEEISRKLSAIEPGLYHLPLIEQVNWLLRERERLRNLASDACAEHADVIRDLLLDGDKADLYDALTKRITG